MTSNKKVSQGRECSRQLARKHEVAPPSAEPSSHLPTRPERSDWAPDPGSGGTWLLNQRAPATGTCPDAVRRSDSSAVTGATPRTGSYRAGRSEVRGGGHSEPGRHRRTLSSPAHVPEPTSTGCDVP